MHKTVVLIGRTNVGKSTLFNRLIGRRKAIVHETPGTTRDRNESLVTWKNSSFNLVDTGGWATDDVIFSAAVKRQLEIALVQSSIALLIVDAKCGLHPLDRELGQLLRESGKKVIVVANKVDVQQDEAKAAEFYRLGFDDMISISANHGRNTFELLDAVQAYLDTLPKEEAEVTYTPISLVLVGKPNVGKSSLLNTLTKEERSIVHDTPGTTRDAVDTRLQYKGQEFQIIDTPGLHKKHIFKNDLDYLTSLSTHHALERADVAVLVIDAQIGIGETETKVAELILKAHRACLIAVNKWDLIEDREEAVKAFNREMEITFPFMKWAKIIFVSAKTGQRTERILSEVQTIYNEYDRTLPYEELRDVIMGAVNRRPLSRKGQVLKIKDIRQADVRPPTIILTVNDPQLVHFSYRRFLENNIRDHFGLKGTPLKIKFYRPKGKEE
jgi:GTP-binding protein